MWVVFYILMNVGEKAGKDILGEIIQKEIKFFLEIDRQRALGKISYRSSNEPFVGVILYGSDMKILNLFQAEFSRFSLECPVICSPPIESRPLVDLGFYCVNVDFLVNSHNNYFPSI